MGPLIWLGSRDLNSVGDLFAGTVFCTTRIGSSTGEKRPPAGL